jgi:hypothetical protein
MAIAAAASPSRYLISGSKACRAHPLAKRIEIVGTLKPKGAVFRIDDKRYVAEVGKAIDDESGQPVAALEGWKLMHIGERVAVFTKRSADLVVCFEAR